MNTLAHNPPMGKTGQSARGASALRERIQAVVFDLDDTLWPIAPVIERAEKAMAGWIRANAPDVAARWDVNTLKLLRASLLAANPALANDVMALRRGTIFAAFDECGGSADQAAQAFEYFRAERQKVAFYPDALPALERLSPHFRLGVISNGFANVAAIGIAHHFETVVSAHEVGVSKPAPEIYAACAERMALAPAQLLYVGDDPANDVVGPMRAGWSAVWINRSEREWPETLGGSHFGGGAFGGSAFGGSVSPALQFSGLNALADWLLAA